MNQFIDIIKEIPFWIWFVLGYVLFIGVSSLKTRTVYLPKLFIIPLILLATTYNTFLSPNAFIFSFMIGCGTILGFIIHINSPIQIIKTSASVKFPGGYSTLLILISFFVGKYFFGYLSALEPDLAVNYTVGEISITGLLSGYFLGQAIYCVYKYIAVCRMQLRETQEKKND